MCQCCSDEKECLLPYFVITRADLEKLESGENMEALTFWQHDKLLRAEESKNEGSDSESEDSDSESKCKE
jgi:hypothetical protein